MNKNKFFLYIFSSLLIYAFFIYNKETSSLNTETEKALLYAKILERNAWDMNKDYIQKYLDQLISTDSYSYILVTLEDQSKIEVKQSSVSSLGKNLFLRVKPIKQNIYYDDQIIATAEFHWNNYNLEVYFYIIIVYLALNIFGFNFYNEKFKREREKENMQSLLQEKEEQANIGIMAAGIAHEINNPLSIIKNSQSLIKKLISVENPNLDKISKYIQTTDKTIERISKIIHSLKTLSRNTESDPFEVHNAFDIVESTTILYHEKFKLNEINFEIVQYDKELKIDCRESEISQVLVNLLNNSIDAITGKNPRWIKITLKKYLDKVQIIVTDCGDGIPENIVDNIFTPFFTTKATNQGTGLGMSISYSLIKNHNGNLFIDKHSPNTQFVIELPLSQS